MSDSPTPPSPAAAGPTAGRLSTRHLLGIDGLTRGDVELIFRTAEGFTKQLQGRIRKVPTLRDITVANIFFENSTRTRISFELAEKRLSADVVNFSAGSSSVKKGETLLDTVNNILAMKVDMVVMRHPAPGAHRFLARHVDARIVNAGDGTHEHPTQALLDAYSMRQRLGDLAGRRVCIVGDIRHSRVALSNVHCLRLLGAEVGVCGPPTLIPKHFAELGVRVFQHLDRALAWCDVANVLRIQLERQDIKYFPSLREYHRLYGVTHERLRRAGKDILILHPGPINRGVEISSAVADDPALSVVLDQVQNGVAIRMAVLYLLAATID